MAYQAVFKRYELKYLLMQHNKHKNTDHLRSVFFLYGK